MKVRGKPVIKSTARKPQPGMVPIPAQLKPTQRMIYPPDNTMPFERWYLNSYLSSDARERLYLPIQWTALYCNNNFGKCNKTRATIQTVLNGLDKNKKYYTIVQYDDGILNDITGLDIKVFAMSGPRIDYPLPLLCTLHGFKFNCKRDIFASFIGRETHPIRTAMIKQLYGKEGYYISTKPHSLKDYCEILARSKYALCPRGYGQSSFRIQEAIEYGAVPVYISDEFIFPYNMPTFVFGPTVECQPDTFDYFELDEWLKAGDAVIHNNLYPMIIEKNKQLFTYTGCKSEILLFLKNEQDEKEVSNTNGND